MLVTDSFTKEVVHRKKRLLGRLLILSTCALLVSSARQACRLAFFICIRLVIWGTAKDLYRTAGFAASTGLKTRPVRLPIAEDEEEGYSDFSLACRASASNIKDARPLNLLALGIRVTVIASPTQHGQEHGALPDRGRRPEEATMEDL